VPSAIVSPNTLLIDWIENGISASPALCTDPSAPTMQMPKCLGFTLASAGM
jgi:hypothetical protein